MVTVTDRAKDELQTALTTHTANLEQGLRLVVTPAGQLGLGLDVVRDGDEIVEHNGAKVLLIGSDLSPLMDGSTVDVEYGLEGPRLTIASL